MDQRKDDKLIRTSANRNGYTLVEVLTVMAVVGLIVGIATISIGSSTHQLRFKKELESFIRVLKMAHTAASESDQRYVVVVNYDEGYYQLRELPNIPVKILTEEKSLAAEMLYDQTEAIIDKDFSDNCRLEYIFFDDGTDTSYLEDSTEIWFYVGRNGWSNAAVLVFSDSEGDPYSVVTNRLTSKIELIEGEALLPGPMAKQDVPF
jgi:prepilin-type N-terminal cleavage/methylation domain-containing protein